MKNIPIALPLLALAGCYYFESSEEKKCSPVACHDSLPQIVSGIPLPDGYTRLVKPPGSFAEWLGNVRLKKDRRVFLYNGSLKSNQSAQFAVLDIPVGDRNLQQCADAIIRMRAEYLFAEKKYDQIEFRDNDNTLYKWHYNGSYEKFESYLVRVFGMCGTASLEKQLTTKNIRSIEPGDVFIRGGFPGHAMIVMDVALNKEGKRIFLLAQSYMPAQDIHIVKNQSGEQLSPWYDATDADEVITPEWTFHCSQLKRWP